METDWYAHYQKKLGNLKFEAGDVEHFYTQSKELIDCLIALKPKRVLEAGAGLGRDAFVLAKRGIRVTMLDLDDRLLELAKENAKRLGVQDLIEVQEGDLFDLSETFLKDSFDVAFSGGTFEHFPDDQIVELIRQQLTVASQVVFTVPILSDANREYFNDTVYRRLLSPDDWRRILAPFEIRSLTPIWTRHDDILVVLSPQK